MDKVEQARIEAFKAGHAYAWSEKLLKQSNPKHQESNWKQLYEKWKEEAD